LDKAGFYRNRDFITVYYPNLNGLDKDSYFASQNNCDYPDFNDLDKAGFRRNREFIPFFSFYININIDKKFYKKNKNKNEKQLTLVCTCITA